MKRVLVIGCGVIGLTTGLTLLREGHDVTILTKSTPPDTTSNAAGAFWYPVLDEPCSSLRNQLALATYNYVHTHILGKHEDAACVERMIDTYYNLELAAPHEDVAKGIPAFKVLNPKDMPSQIKCIGGFSFQSFVVDTDVYLHFLLSQFTQEGGKLVVKELHNLGELLNEVFNGSVTYDGVVNCTGLGAETVFGDETVFPVRGQTILVTPIPGYDRVLYIDSDDPTYIIPRKTDTVLGGTYQVGNHSITPDPEDTQNILKKVSLFGVHDVTIKKEKVGLRPGRSVLRLECNILSPLDSSQKAGIPLVHNYGHGGRGFTLSWGCALHTAKLLQEAWSK